MAINANNFDEKTPIKILRYWSQFQLVGYFHKILQELK